MTESMLIEDRSDVGGGESINTDQKKIQECIETARLVYKQLKPKPEKLKQSLFAAELEQDFEMGVQEVKKKTLFKGDVEKL